MTSKRALVAAIVAQISDEIDTMARLAKDAADAATHEENKPENDKDMRSTEASYLARGQAARVAELSAALAQLQAMELHDFAEGEAIGVSALVELQSKTGTSTCFVVPAGGGRKVRLTGERERALEVQTTTPTSPLGEALVGLAAGDEAEVETPQGVRTWMVLQVR
ncbi:MAG: GreA/GreB family elongation factor [Deltaproteobacteria bacterium]|nr:GreA/GreB family elongation factor [Deltaproteobacteria bacterium]